MNPLLYTIPAHLIQQVEAHHVELFGAVLKEVASGRIVGHVQQTGMLDSLLASATQGLSATLSQGFSPLGLISVVQNHQIASRLAEMHQTLSILQNLQIGTLAVSGLGLGVSVAGFAVMLKRLKGIEAHLKTIEDKLEKVTEDRRRDEVRMILADVATELDAVDTLRKRSDPRGAGQAAQRGLATCAGRLGAHAEAHVERMQGRKIGDEDLELLWSLLAAIQLCHEAGTRALFALDDLRAAEGMAERQAARLLAFSSTLSPDALARLFTVGNDAAEDIARIRIETLPKARTLVKGSRDAVAGVATQATLARSLIDNGVSGPEYIDAVAEERKDPLVFLPA